MALVDVISVNVSGANPASFSEPFEFEITFECIDKLEDDLEWKLVYVGSAGDESKDQVLEEVMVGPVPMGTSKFVLQADPPDFMAIPEQDRLGVTVVSITCSYREQPFANVGYYVNTEYYPEQPPGEGGLPQEAAEVPKPIDLAKVYRNVMADEPRVTRYAIKWTGDVDRQEGLPPPAAEAVVEEGNVDDEENEDEDDDDDEAAPENNNIAAEDDDDDDDEEDEEEEENDEEEVDLEAEDDDEDEEDDDAPSSKRQKTASASGEDDDEDEDVNNNQ